MSFLSRQALRLLSRPSRTCSTRQFSRSPPSAILPSFEDPSRKGLFYHAIERDVQPSPAFAVSFLREPPTIPNSATILGYLPAAAEKETEEAGLHDFIENSSFVGILHRAVKRALESEADETVTAEALQRGSGWLHINDSRKIPALGRIGDPDDILGSVRVEDGKILPLTYEPMPSYRVCTADGLTMLSEGLARTLLEELKTIHDREERSKALPSQ